MADNTEVVRCNTGIEKRNVIVIGMDGSESSRQALHWAVAQAKVTGATLEAVMAWDPPIPWGRMPRLPSGRDPEDEMRKRLAEEVESVLGPHGALDVKEIVVRGQPAPALIAASKHANMLVVGSRGHGAFAGTLLGSVSRHCVTNATCPVVVVRHQSPGVH